MEHYQVKKIFEEYFNGDKNFMTPVVIGFEVKVVDDNHLLLIEKSRSRDRDLYGVTVLLYNKETCDCGRVDLSDCFKSLYKAKRYINDINPEDVINGYRFGEVKNIKV